MHSRYIHDFRFSTFTAHLHGPGFRFSTFIDGNPTFTDLDFDTAFGNLPADALWLGVKVNGRLYDAELAWADSDDPYLLPDKGTAQSNWNVAVSQLAGCVRGEATSGESGGVSSQAEDSLDLAGGRGEAAPSKRTPPVGRGGNSGGNTLSSREVRRQKMNPDGSFACDRPGGWDPVCADAMVDAGVVGSMSCLAIGGMNKCILGAVEAEKEM